MYKMNNLFVISIILLSVLNLSIYAEIKGFFASSSASSALLGLVIKLFFRLTHYADSLTMDNRQYF